MRVAITIADRNISVGEEFAATRELRRKLKASMTAGRERYWDRHLAAGLCVDCPRKATDGRKRCRVCTQRNADRVKAWRERRKERAA